MATNDLCNVDLVGCGAGKHIAGWRLMATDDLSNVDLVEGLLTFPRCPSSTELLIMGSLPTVLLCPFHMCTGNSVSLLPCRSGR